MNGKLKMTQKGIKMRVFAVGDIHGRFEALKEVLVKCKFNYEKDKLIILGDIVDGGYNTDCVIEELLKIKNKILLMGNHDEWLLNHIKTGWAEEMWLQQGGVNTLRSYGGKVKEADYITDNSIINTTNIKIPVTHQEFLNTAKYWHIENNMLFVHGGFDPNIPIENNTKHDLVWDRSLIEYAREGNVIKGYDKVFIGHSTTQIIEKNFFNFKCKDCGYEWSPFKSKCKKCQSKNIFYSRGKTEPIIYQNLYCLDCGSGWNGRLCIYDINNEKYWLSQLQIPAIEENKDGT